MNNWRYNKYSVINLYKEFLTYGAKVKEIQRFQWGWLIILSDKQRSWDKSIRILDMNVLDKDKPYV